jgi:hypothetical protein
MPFFGLIFPFLAKSLFRGVKAKHPPPIPLPSHGIMFGDNVFIAVCKDERFFETERVQFSSKTFICLPTYPIEHIQEQHTMYCFQYP